MWFIICDAFCYAVFGDHSACTYVCVEELRERQLPQRAGLRERRATDVSRLTRPTVTETWVAEEELNLSEIKQFFERYCQLQLVLWLFLAALMKFSSHLLNDCVNRVLLKAVDKE